jgi:hypothetical protein
LTYRHPIACRAIILVASTLPGLNSGWANEIPVIDSGSSINIKFDECSSHVELDTSDALLSDVMLALAAELNFKLNFRSDNDRPMSASLRRPPRELVEILGKDDNIMIMGEPIDRCGQQDEQLTAVWFLGAGPEVTYRRAKSRGIDELPATGDAVVNADGSTAGREGKQRRKKDLSPEEKYYEQLQRKSGKDD